MKLLGKNMPPGEWAFKALVGDIYPHYIGTVRSGEWTKWYLTEEYFLTENDVKLAYGHRQFKWPVEEYEGGMVYVPTEEELKE